MRVLPLEARFFVDGKALHIPNGKITWVVLPPRSRTLEIRGGFAAVGEMMAIKKLHYQKLPRYRRSRVSTLSFDPSTLRASGVAPADTRWIVLKQGYSDGWRLKLDRGQVIRHIETNGYANAWEVRLSRSTNVTIAYEPATAINLLERLSLFMWALACIVCLSAAWRQSLAPMKSA